MSKAGGGDGGGWGAGWGGIGETGGFWIIENLSHLDEILRDG